MINLNIFRKAQALTSPNYNYNNFSEMLLHNRNQAPHKTIIRQYKVKLTNQQLANKVFQVAQFLHNLNIKPQDKVALVMDNSWEFIVNLLAINYIGAVVVPINHFLQEQELSYILNHCDAKLLFVSLKKAEATKNLIQQTKLKNIVWVGGVPQPEVATQPNIQHIDYLTIVDNPIIPHIAHNPTNINDVAVIVYTSGTTGQPKGVMLSCKNIFSNCHGIKSLMAIKNQQLQLICYLPMFHAFTFTVNIILPMYYNSTIIIISSLKNKADFKYLLSQILISRCRYFTGVPDIYKIMTQIKLPWYFHAAHNVRGFISGAAPLSISIQHNFSKIFKRGTLIEGYGISECSPVVSCNTIQYNRIGTVGRPLLNYQVRIYNENMQELPIGEIGEVCVRGDCVMLGYYNDLKATGANIINGWFKTGDLGKVDIDGYIYLVDRIKDIIINKGMNIYPSEVETLLNTHDKISDCAVIGEKDIYDNETPVAYVVMVENANITPEEIKIFLKNKLASFKIPKKIIITATLPKNATGKVLKRELRRLHNQSLFV